MNEPDGDMLPRLLFLARIPAGNVWRLESDLARGLEARARREPTLPTPPREPHRLAEYMSLLCTPPLHQLCQSREELLRATADETASKE